MTIRELFVKANAGEAPKTVADVFYKTSETLPDGYAEGSIAYCYDGADKGKVKVFDGENWIQQ